MSDLLTLPELDELAELSRRFETAPASSVVRWAWERFGRGVVLASSFQDCVLLDVAVRVAPDIEVVFLDTGFHFPETLDYVEQVRRRYDLNLRVVRPEVGADEWPCGTARCCELRKVAPLARILEDRQAWMTGLRRADAATRADAPILSLDPARGAVKINPLATWDDRDVAGYASDHGLPEHPLTRQGYLSIGCAPTTQPTLDPDDPRSGRWAGTEKTECGLHL
ncbi:MAG TPA: phosphoadenylyl-sulfate reductase [Acidimicrobiales bacterium]|nr:phosphoadenylyl-sulfate reductase [Acidimicrobiales bacterium]